MPINTVIPYWHSPVSIVGSVFCSGECNNFFIPNDPRYDDNGTHGYWPHPPLVPLPIPDGKGVIGILNARTAIGDTISDRHANKSYISNFLLRPLKKDSVYRLSFYLGFGIKDTSVGVSYCLSFSPMKISLWATEDSSRIPFPFPPANEPSNCLSIENSAWILLGTRTITANPGTWVKDSIQFTAPQDMQVLAIGPACDFSDIPHPFAAYEAWDVYYLDHLQFYQSPTPSATIGISSGSLCDGPNASVTLQLKAAAFYTGSQLQWYKNNAAINETAGSVIITKTKYGEGWYQCGVQNDSVCARSDSFHVVFDPLPSNIIGKNPDTTACTGDTVLLQVNGGSRALYLWDDGSTLSSKPIVQNGTYNVQISNSCATVTATKTVNFKDCPVTVYVPTGFSPNGDGLK